MIKPTKETQRMRRDTSRNPDQRQKHSDWAERAKITYCQMSHDFLYTYEYKLTKSLDL